MFEWFCGLTMQEWRDFILTVLAPTALVFGVWRTITAHRQERLARLRLTNDEYSEARSLLGHRNTAVRVGAVITLADFARSDVDEYHVRVMKLFAAFLVWPPRYSGGLLAGLVDFHSPDTREVIETINRRSASQRAAERIEEFSFSDRLSLSHFRYTEDTGVDWTLSMIEYGLDERIAERRAQQAAGDYRYGRNPTETGGPTGTSN